MSTNKNGFTLMEILVVVAITSVAFAAVFSLSSVSFTDPLENEFERIVALLYSSRDLAFENQEEVVVNVESAHPNVVIEYDNPPHFEFGVHIQPTTITLTYGGRSKEIHISDLGVINY